MNKHVKVILDAHVPFMQRLNDIADVSVLAPDQITPDAVQNADALIIRTRTKCNASLLSNSSVKFIGTATIGFDHIDRDFCAQKGITAVNAPGCNAPAVAQYVFASLLRLTNRPISQYTIGIVGVGHIGSIIDTWARSLHMKVLLCDPPRGLRTSLSDIAEHCDIITFHTPLTRSGEHPTFHLADKAFFNVLRKHPIIINAARGPVVDTHAWIDAILSGKCSHAIVDCWEGEPQINSQLLNLASIATPHIAGYSLQGKLRASQIIADAFCSHFDLPHFSVTDSPIPTTPSRVLAPLIAKSYDPTLDMAALRANPQLFEQLRDQYPLRNEIPDIHIFGY